MTGSWSVEVKAIRPFTIHGDMYWELQVTRIDVPDADATLRIPRHACRSEPIPGQRLSVTFLMGQVTAAALLP